MSSTTIDALVIGAGVSGLAAAIELRAAGREVLVLEAEDRPGGVIRTDEREGFRVERGPNAFRVSAPLRAWLAQHGLESELLPAGAEARLRALFLDGRLLWLPESPLGVVTTRLLSPGAKARAVGELFRTRGPSSGETVAEFVSRRFGRDVLERAIAPFLVGVYAGDERQLGAEAVFPQWVAWEREHGSIIRGALATWLQRDRPRGLSGSQSTATGVEGFVAALVSRLGDAVLCGTTVDEISPGEGGVVVRAGACEWCARELVVALPAREAGQLLASQDDELGGLFRGIEYAPMVSLALSVDPTRSREKIRGFGYLVPRNAGLPLLGALFPARVFPDRAPEGRELVMAMIGGARWEGAVDAPDDKLLEVAAEGLHRTLGAELDRDPLAVCRWRRAVPQPEPNHRTHIRELRAAMARTWPAVRLAGSYLDGVSVGDALLSGVRAAESFEPTAKPS